MDFAKPEPGTVPPSRAVLAMQAAASSAQDFGEAVWGKAKDVASNFRSVGVDEDGEPNEARALTAAKRGGSAIKGAAVGGASAVAGGMGAVAGRFKRKGAGDDASKPDA